jgi:hypothetical protein
LEWLNHGPYYDHVVKPAHRRRRLRFESGLGLNRGVTHDGAFFSPNRLSGNAISSEVIGPQEKGGVTAQASSGVRVSVLVWPKPARRVLLALREHSNQVLQFLVDISGPVHRPRNFGFDELTEAAAQPMNGDPDGAVGESELPSDLGL